MDETVFIRRLVAVLGLDVEAIDCTPQADLYADWALDSFMSFQLIVAVESLAEAVVPPAYLPEMYTAHDAYEYYCQLRRGLRDQL